MNYDEFRTSSLDWCGIILTMAYWINTYNVLVIKIIINNPDENSINETAWGLI